MTRNTTLGLIPLLFTVVACASMTAPGSEPRSPDGQPPKRAAIDAPAAKRPTCETPGGFLESIERQLRAHSVEIRSCYARYGLSANSEFEVRAFVEVRTDAQQRVVLARPVNATSVEVCLTEAMADWTLPAGTSASPAHFMMRVPFWKDDLAAAGAASPFTPENVATAVRERVPDIKNYYERALKRRRDLKGRIVVEWTINRGGHVSLAMVAEDALRDDEVTAYVLRRVLEMTFIAPAEPVDISYPFVFQTTEGR